MTVLLYDLFEGKDFSLLPLERSVYSEWWSTISERILADTGRLSSSRDIDPALDSQSVSKYSLAGNA